MEILRRINRKYGISSQVAGRKKEQILKILQKKYQFNDWHLTPVNFRPYAVDTVRTLNWMLQRGDISGPLVEMGCGLGGIIGNLESAERKYGYDLSSEAIKCASILFPSVRFQIGTYASVRETDIGCLIMLNFSAGISPTELSDAIQQLLSRSRVEMFLIDTFTRNASDKDYPYTHDGAKLYGDTYHDIGVRTGY